MWRCPVGAQKCSPPGHQNQVFPGCPVCGLHAPSCCGRIVTATGVVVGGTGSGPGFVISVFMVI